MLYAINGLESRPTVDVDFMADRIGHDRDYLAHVFHEILDIVCDEDGVTFDVDSIKLEPITVEKKYPGTRFYFFQYNSIGSVSGISTFLLLAMAMQKAGGTVVES